MISIIIGFLLLLLAFGLSVAWWIIFCIKRGHFKAGKCRKFCSYSDLYNIGNPFS